MGNKVIERLSRWGFTRAGWMDNRHGEWWLAAQLLLIAAHFLPATPAPNALGMAWPVGARIAGGVIFVLGVALGGRGVLNLGASLSPLPEPMAGAALIREGAYAHCRHPLYRSLLIGSLGVTVALGSLLHLGLLLGLAIVLVSKAHREEARLLQVHADYADYRASTPAIVACVPGLDWRGS